MENTLDSLFKGNLKAFQEGVKASIFSKIDARLDTARRKIANFVFNEETESTDAEFKEKVNHADKDGYPEDKDDDDEDDQGGGEYLVHVKMLDVPNTELENFRVVGTSKADVESKLEKFYGKGKYEVKSIKLSEEVVDEAKVDRDSYKVYHGSYSSAIGEAGEHAKRRGYTHDPEELASKVGFGPEKPKDGVSNSFSVHLYKDGEKQKRMHHFQVYGMGNGRYELNQYMDPKGRGKQTSNESTLESKGPSTLHNINYKGMTAPEMLKAELPLHRHIEKELANHGHEKGTKEYKEQYDNALAFYNRFGAPKGRGKQTSNESTLEEGGRFEKGEDIGKPGLNFKKIAKKAGAEYGSEEAGKRVAGSILKKILKKKVANEDVIMEATASSLEKSKFGSAHSGGVHYSKIGGKDTEWNYVGKDKSGKNVVIDNRDDAHSILHKGKLLSLYKENEKLGKGDASNGDLDHLFGKTKKVSEEKLVEAVEYRDGGYYAGKNTEFINGHGELTHHSVHFHQPASGKKAVYQILGAKDKEEAINVAKSEHKKHPVQFPPWKFSHTEDQNKTHQDYIKSGKVHESTIVEAKSPGEKYWAKKVKAVAKAAEKPNIRLVQTHVDGDKTAKVYKNNDHGEYQVKFHSGGTYHKDNDYFSDDKDDAHATAKSWIKAKNEEVESPLPYHKSFSDALEEAKKFALASGYKHESGEFDSITNAGFIKPAEDKTHAFHCSLQNAKTGKDVLNKIHNFQITGHGNSKFTINQDIK